MATTAASPYAAPHTPIASAKRPRVGSRGQRRTPAGSTPAAAASTATTAPSSASASTSKATSSAIAAAAAAAQSCPPPPMATSGFAASALASPGVGLDGKALYEDPGSPYHAPRSVRDGIEENRKLAMQEVKQEGFHTEAHVSEEYIFSPALHAHHHHHHHDQEQQQQAPSSNSPGGGRKRLAETQVAANSASADGDVSAAVLASSLESAATSMSCSLGGGSLSDSGEFGTPAEGRASNSSSSSSGFTSSSSVSQHDSGARGGASAATAAAAAATGVPHAAAGAGSGNGSGTLNEDTVAGFTRRMEELVAASAGRLSPPQRSVTPHEALAAATMAQEPHQPAAVVATVAAADLTPPSDAATVGVTAAAPVASPAPAPAPEEEEDEEEEFNPYLFIKNLPPHWEVVKEQRICLPPRMAIHHGRPTLVLDLDETLVHCTVEKIDDADLIFPVRFNNVDYQVHARKRPYLDYFLDFAARHFEVVVFTASQPVYAHTLLDMIDPKGRISHRLYREACLEVDGNFLKDLTVLGREMHRVVLVDNSPHAYGFQIDCGIPIESWFDNTRDSELLKLIPFLRILTRAPDVRPLVRERFRTFALVEDA